MEKRNFKFNRLMEAINKANSSLHLHSVFRGLSMENYGRGV